PPSACRHVAGPEVAAPLIIVEEPTMLELLGPAMSITTAALLARSSLLIWRAESKLLKWVGTGLAAFFSTAVSVISVIMIVGLFKLHARGAPALDFKVAATPEQILRGQAISNGFCDRFAY